MFSVDMKSCTLIATLHSWIEALESIDYFYKNIRISVHRYLLNPESSLDQLRNEIMNYDSSDVTIHSYGNNNIDVSCVSIHGKDNNNTNTSILLFPKIWKIYRNYNKYITIVKNLINDYHSGYNVQPIIDQLKQILSIAIQKQPYFKKAVKNNNNHNDDEQFFTEEENEEILKLSKKLQKLYAKPLADYGIYDISVIESIINLNNNSFHIFLNTPERDEIIGIQSKKRIITHHFHTNNYHGKKFIIPVRTDRHINHLLENVATVLVQKGIHDISSLKRIYIKNELLNYGNNYSIVLADGRIFEVTNDNEGFYISEMDPIIMTTNMSETVLSTDNINLTQVNNDDNPSKQNYTLNLSSVGKNNKEENQLMKKNEFDSVIEDIMKEIGLLTTFSKKVEQKYNTDIYDQYSSSITKLFPELPLNNKKSIKKKINSLVERIHLLEYYRKACEYENVSPYEEDLKTMTNEEILEEANYLTGILQE